MTYKDETAAIRRRLKDEDMKALMKKLADDGYVLTLDEVYDAVARTVDFLRVIHEETRQVRRRPETEDLPPSLR